MGLRGIGSRPLSIRHPGLSERMPVPVAPGWQTHAQRMWLLYGFDQKWVDAFRDEAHYRETWKQRETLMQECPPGRRPIGWWRIEGPFPYPGFDNEKLALYAAGLLSEDEVRELRRSLGPIQEHHTKNYRPKN